MFSKFKETRERRVTKRDKKVTDTGRGENQESVYLFVFFPSNKGIDSSKRDFESF